MSDSDPYLQFPLCALAYGASPFERLNSVISFCFIRAGYQFTKDYSSDYLKEKAREIAEGSNLPSDFSRSNKDHVKAMVGANRLGILPSTLESSFENYRNLYSFWNTFVLKHGFDSFVRIRKDLVFKARDNEGMSYREFSILCAIYSVIGEKTYPVRVTRESVQCRMLGYKKQAIMKEELLSRKDCAMPLSIRQIGYTIDKLHSLQFFARARANERQTYYSNRMPQGQFEEALFHKKTYEARFNQERRSKDESLMARIKAAKKGNLLK